MSAEKLYRPCVGVALFNKEGKVFVGERIDTPGAWQMPQGGIDFGETPEKTALRELQEEIGTNNADIIYTAPYKIRYDLPDAIAQKLWNGKFCGQEQTWIAARFRGKNTDINLNAHTPPEFSDWKWVYLEDTLELIVPFKKDLYAQIIELFRHINPD